MLIYAFIPLNDSNDARQMNKFIIVDGGYLLHKVIWPQNNSYFEIANNYSSYLKKHYGTNVAVIFDGYPSDPAQRGTKSSERLRRSKMNTCTDIMVKGNLRNQVEQSKFLRNENNKNQLIALLKK